MLHWPGHPALRELMTELHDDRFLEKVERTHGSKFALGPISARLEVGVTCLVGANGAGKNNADEDDRWH